MKQIQTILFVFLSFNPLLSSTEWTWTPPDNDVETKIEYSEKADCVEFLESIPSKRSENQKWIGDLRIRLGWDIVENKSQEHVGKEAVKFRLIEKGDTDESKGYSRISITVYQWPNMSPISKLKMKKLYDNFYYQQKIKFQIIKHYVEEGNIKELNIENYDPTIEMLLLDVGPTRNILEGGVSEGDLFNWSSDNGLYYFDFEKSENVVSAVKDWVKEIYETIDEESGSGLNFRSIFGINNLDCTVCGEISDHGYVAKVSDNTAYYIFKKNEYRLDDAMKAHLDFVSVYSDVNDLEIYIEGRASPSGGGKATSGENLGYNNLSWLRANSVHQYLKSKGLIISDGNVLALGANDQIVPANKEHPLNRSAIVEVVQPFVDLPEIKPQVPAHANVPSTEWAIQISGIFILELAGVSVGCTFGYLKNKEINKSAYFELYCTPDGKDLGVIGINAISPLIKLGFDKDDKFIIDIPGTQNALIKETLSKPQVASAKGGLLKFWPTIAMGGDSYKGSWAHFTTPSVTFADFHESKIRFNNITGLGFDIGIIDLSSALTMDFLFPTIKTTPSSFSYVMKDLKVAGFIGFNGSGVMDIKMFSEDN